MAVRLAAGPVEEAMDWLCRYERFWSGRLDRLAVFAEAEEAKCGTPGASPNTREDTA